MAEVEPMEDQVEEASGVIYKCGECLTLFENEDEANAHVQECSLPLIEETVAEEISVPEDQVIQDEETEFQAVEEVREEQSEELVTTADAQEDPSGAISRDQQQTVVFECRTCGLRFRTPHAYANHYVSTHAASSTACPICGNWYSTRSNLKAHIMLHTGLRPHACPICNKRFAVLSNLRCHLRIHENRVKCPHCRRTLASPAELESHTKTAHAAVVATGSNLSCPYCQKEFSHASTLRGHIRNQHTDGARNLVCEYCTKEFSNRSNLEVHIRSHTGEKPFECGKCGRAFAVMSNLKAHLRIHNGDRRHPCNQCNKSFYSKFDLRQHSYTHTGERPHECDLCGERFAKVGNLNAHRMTHISEKPHKCEICGAGFSKAELLSKHTRRFHNPMNTQCPLQCAFCGQYFQQVKQCREHVKEAHAADSLSAKVCCSHCPRKFVTETQLAEHERTLHKLQATLFCKYCRRPYANESKHRKHEESGVCLQRRCKICWRQCKSPSDYEAHVRTHSDERPFACEICDKHFNKEVNLVRHRLVHKGLRYNCMVCFNKFLSEAAIHKHMQQAHPGMFRGKLYVNVTDGTGGSTKLIIVNAPNDEGMLLEGAQVVIREGHQQVVQIEGTGQQQEKQLQVLVKGESGAAITEGLLEHVEEGEAEAVALETLHEGEDVSHYETSRYVMRSRVKLIT
ncbi:zinc finger protein 497-like isoform X2 [Varroa jacobsoni]|nr:zinc finger protein 497-like isoform X2 [Varroa destructor]XP_022667302.1 zinc finger protein 497-like isoform X2 [Varroa destructor]XP_022709420.1 zinc finger protein 497-like isoform X2 [Varroa jacobsoni]